MSFSVGSSRASCNSTETLRFNAKFSLSHTSQVSNNDIQHTNNMCTRGPYRAFLIRTSERFNRLKRIDCRKAEHFRFALHLRMKIFISSFIYSLHDSMKARSSGSIDRCYSTFPVKSRSEKLNWFETRYNNSGGCNFIINVQQRDLRPLLHAV